MKQAQVAVVAPAQRVLLGRTLLQQFWYYSASEIQKMSQSEVRTLVQMILDHEKLNNLGDKTQIVHRGALT